MQRHENRFEIDLDRSRSPRAFRDHQNLWHDDLSRLYQLITRHVSMIDEAVSERPRGAKTEGDQDLPHLSIAIFGPSGSGKSSLLRTLADDVDRSKDSIHPPVRPKSLEGKIATLPVMDPTTWAESDQLLYAFLASALEKENDSLDEGEYGYPKGLSPVQLAFQEVNEYLRVIDEPEHTEEHDPLGLSLQKLERHTSGLRLKKALGKFIHALVGTLRSEIVLLPIDDLDLAPNHLVRALQSYQSFLTHGRLVPVFCFTDRMPEELIEVYYRHTLRDQNQQHPIESATARLSISEQLAVQFLARCFPVRNRIRLGPAPARVQRARMRVRIDRDRVTSGDAPKQQVLELLTTASFLLFGHPDREDAHLVKAALRPSTLRRQFQVVDAMADCRLHALRTPQFGLMAGLSVEEIEKIGEKGHTRIFGDTDEVTTWKKRVAATSPEHGLEARKTGKEGFEGQTGSQDVRLCKRWPEIGMGGVLKDAKPTHAEKGGKQNPSPAAIFEGFELLARRLHELEREATWAKIFNSATWSLLNVHRDTLRELGLFLEDLYSWSPKELRSVVIENILTQERSVRRSVVDRWFNRADYRRSQVLSLLAANIFRPWMHGEEPYGDEEVPIRQTINLERKHKGFGLATRFDRAKKEIYEDPEAVPKRRDQIQGRLTIPAPQALIWFLNVTLGFYLPQIMARNWSRAVANDEPVRGRMNGYGWDLQHAPINAARIADAKVEAFSFGMLFLNTEEFQDTFSGERLNRNLESREELLLRIWTCYGYSSGRFWACFSIWRGLGFIGQAIELGYRNQEFFEHRSKKASKRKAEKAQYRDARDVLRTDMERLIRSHCLGGLVPGSLLNRNEDEGRLSDALCEFRPWSAPTRDGIRGLANSLVDWLEDCWDDVVFPLPAGELHIGWGDCFIRRVHGEYILGSLWPRLDAAYLEKQPGLDAGKGKKRQKGTKGKEGNEGQKNRWQAWHAANAWSSYILQYWRGCPPILHLLLTCPAFLRSDYYFGEKTKDVWKRKADPSLPPNKPHGQKAKSDHLPSASAWIDRLKIPPALAEHLMGLWWGTKPKSSTVIPRTWSKSDQTAVISDMLKIERVTLEGFYVPEFDYHRAETREWRRHEDTRDSEEGEVPETKAEVTSS
ncbi:MAG: hypothetical protein AAGC60_09440 [Acidobacteriota bacterium]